LHWILQHSLGASVFLSLSFPIAACIKNKQAEFLEEEYVEQLQLIRYIASYCVCWDVQVMIRNVDDEIWDFAEE